MATPSVPTEEVVDLSPFKRMVMTIGTLPTAFTESMTYYEALAYFVKYLKETIIPAVNQNAEATKELQRLFIELKDYVDNYFDNLDVQEEINNKLDDMAQSGELAEIIAQYLGLGAVYGFDNIASMSVATYVIEGSICKVLGKTNAMTGDGSYYRIRQRINTDEPDGVNLVVMTNTTNLVAEIVPDYFINNLQNQIGNIEELNTNDKSNLVNAINEVNAKNFDHYSINDNLVDFPLLFTKKNDGSNNGNLQSMTATFNEDGTPATIYQWVDYTSYSKLYVTTCGNRETGSGWSTTMLSSGVDQIPYSHGSTISEKDGYILVGEIGDETHPKLYGKINPANGSYTIEDLSEYLPEDEYYIVSIMWDEVSKTYNVLISDNLTHYILDEQFNLLRTYTYSGNGYDFTSSYAFQGYDYFNSYEYRVLSTTSGRAICLVIDTINGDVIKTINLKQIIGEIEGICVHNNIALFAYNNADAYCDLIQHFYVTESYIGGYPENNVKLIQDYSPILHHSNIVQGILGDGTPDCNVTIYFKNTYSNSEMVRYVGDGSETNPIKSGSTLATLISILNNINTSVGIKVIFDTSTNTDDTGLRLTTKLPNIKELDIDCNTKSGNMTHLWIVNVGAIIKLRKITITSPNNTRRDNNMTLASDYQVIFYNNSTVPAFVISNNTYIRCVNSNVSATGNSSLIENICVESTQTLNTSFTTTGTLSKSRNNLTD